jgi:hypothetical protein
LNRYDVTAPSNEYGAPGTSRFGGAVLSNQYGAPGSNSRSVTGGDEDPLSVS